MKRILVPVVLMATMATMAAACSHGARPGAGSATSTTRPQVRLIAALQPADSCSDLLDWIRAESKSHVGPYGFDSGVRYDVPETFGNAQRVPVTSGPPMAASSAASDASSGSSQLKSQSADPSTDSTGTNNQEAGVDEPDQFKSDGRRAVMTDGQRMMSIDVSGPTPKLLGQVDLPMTGARLFLRGDHVLAVGQASTTSGSPTGELVELAEIDLSAGTPHIAAQASVDGQLVDGRLSDGTVRVVVSTAAPTRVPFVSPQGSDAASVRRATTLNRAAVDQSTADQWLPSWTPPGGSPKPLEDCSSVFHPHDWAGASILSVLSITDGLADLHPVGVVTSGQTVYASASALYVATQQDMSQQWNDDGTPKTTTPAPETTSIHRFDIGGSRQATYRGSSQVFGSVAGQYSMSEQSGDLRVVSATTPRPIVEPVQGGPIECPPNASCARPLDGTSGAAASGATEPTTTVPPDTTTTTAPPVTAPTTSGTLLTVLRLQGDQLEAVGRLDGLAPGEQVKSVRFLGDRAYVVTFRQVDPLFVVDISDPTKPTLLGQVVTPGFSAYLHPVGDNLLFGVGTTIGRYNEPDGSKVSLYDTTDPTHPTEVTSIPIPGSATNLDSDPHAFTWDSRHHLAFVSTNEQGQDGIEHDGLFVYRIEGHTITWVGFIDHSAHATNGGRGPISSPGCAGGTFCPDIAYAAPASPANRVIVNGDQVLAASNDGVSARPVDTLKESAWVGWSD